MSNLSKKQQANACTHASEQLSSNKTKPKSLKEAAKDFDNITLIQERMGSAKDKDKAPVGNNRNA